MRIFISGGAKNGKSHFAQNLAVETARKLSKEKRSEVPLYYIATMIPTDDEDRDRIARHVKDRDGLGFITIEKGANISEIELSEGVFLLDSITALLANNMFPKFNPHAAEDVIEDLERFIEMRENIIFVSDYIYGEIIKERSHADYEGAIDYGDADYTDAYMRGLSRIDRFLADKCDNVYELSAGIAVQHK